MYLALTDLFRARWTERIHEEWISGVLKDRPDLTRDKLTRVRDLMNFHVSDALVTGFDELIPSLTLPDPNDRHVLAAAIRGRADVIVTKNLGMVQVEVALGIRCLLLSPLLRLCGGEG